MRKLVKKSKNQHPLREQSHGDTEEKLLKFPIFYKLNELGFGISNLGFFENDFD